MTAGDHGVRIREFRAKDAVRLRGVFMSSVHTLASGFYTVEQLEAWAPATYDESEWARKLAKLRPFVAKRVREADVDDVVQEVFLRIQRGLSSLRDDQRFGPWVYQIARSAIVDHARVVARHPQARTEPPEPPEPSHHPHEDDDGAVEREVAMYAALFVSMLPSPYR